MNDLIKISRSTVERYLSCQRCCVLEKKYKIKPQEVTFLSANTWDVSGSGNYGYNSVWVNRNNAIFDNLDLSFKTSRIFF